MYSLVTHIHPSYRSALGAWFFGRALLWMALAVSGRPGWVAAQYFAEFEAGTPGWSALVHAVGLLGAWAPLGLALLGEVAILIGAIAVYNFVRRDQLPQTAESATWLWALSPAMAWTLPAGDWALGAVFVALALAALGAKRLGWAAGLLGVAIAFRPEAVVLWPGLAWVGWRGFQPGKQHPGGLWGVIMVPPVVFVGVVLGAISLAGRWGVSLRGLQADSPWRRELVWHGVGAHSAELLVVAALLAALMMAVGFWRQAPRAWPLLALPCLLLPLCYQPPGAAAVAVLFAVPLFGYLGRVAADPVMERPLMAASAGTLVLLALM